MGWASAGYIFDPVAKALVELNAPDEVKTRVLGDLIGALQDGDWDTESESLSQFSDDPAIVEAFRQHDVIVKCGDDGDLWCVLERGHGGDFHEEWSGKQWPRQRDGGQQLADPDGN